MIHFKGLRFKFLFFQTSESCRKQINMYNDLPPKVAMFDMKSSDSIHSVREDHRNYILAGRPASHLHRPSEHDSDVANDGRFLGVFKDRSLQ